MSETEALCETLSNEELVVSGGVDVLECFLSFRVFVGVLVGVITDFLFGTDELCDVDARGVRVLL